MSKIRAEWEPLKKVVIHRPGLEMFFGLMDPTNSLYERAFSRKDAQREHENLENVLAKEFHVEVLRLKDAIVQAAKKDAKIRDKLIAFSREVIRKSAKAILCEDLLREFDNNTKHIDSEDFFDLIVLNPGLEITIQGGLHNFMVNVEGKQPFSNLYFMRDQQFVTDKGLILSRMAIPVRQGEPEITKFLWKEVLNVPIFYEMQAPGTIEGGEFIPMGNFALVGIGSRTNRSAIDQLTSLPFDFEELGVVHQPPHPLISATEPDPMVNMHLDTYFNVASSNVVVGNELLLKNAQVEIWYNEGKKKFVKSKKTTNLYDYIKSKKFEIVNITTLEQLSYASNFLCIEDGKILAIEVGQVVGGVLRNLELKAKQDSHRYGKLYAQSKKDYEDLKKKAEFFPHKKQMGSLGISYYPVILRNLTGGYGGAHCMTCALSRGKIV
jgi:arginine deiminase